MPLARKQDGTYGDLTWNEALSLAASKLNGVSGEEIVGVIGEQSDVESILALKDLLNRFDSDYFEIRGEGVPQLSGDFRANYLMNSRIQGIEDADVLLLVGTNPKVESPLLNSRIYRAVKRKQLKVFMVGPANDTTYDYTHLGNNASILAEIASGNHPFAARLQKASLPMILTGSSVFERADAQAVYESLKLIATSTPVVNEAKGWNGFNVLHEQCGQINALELGITSRRSKKSPKVIVLLGADNHLNTRDFP